MKSEPSDAETMEVCGNVAQHLNVCMYMVLFYVLKCKLCGVAPLLEDFQ